MADRNKETFGGPQDGGGRPMNWSRRPRWQVDNATRYSILRLLSYVLAQSAKIEINDQKGLHLCQAVSSKGKSFITISQCFNIVISREIEKPVLSRIQEQRHGEYNAGKRSRDRQWPWGNLTWCIWLVC